MNLGRQRSILIGQRAAGLKVYVLSAEIGNVNATTIALTFKQSVSARNDDYLSGFGVQVNSLDATILSSARQADNITLYMVLNSPVHSGDTVTISYNKTAGKIFGLSSFESTSVANNRPAFLHSIYVATTGNDSTGNGSQGNPYQTITKALAVAVAGDTILLADGTYAEKTGSSGWLTVSKTFANWVVIQPASGSNGSVVITGTSSLSPSINVYITYFGGGGNDYYHFRYLTFTPCAGSGSTIRTTGIIHHITFEHCTWSPQVIAGGISFYNTPTVCDDLRLDRCTMQAPTGLATCHGLQSGVPSGMNLTVYNSTLASNSQSGDPSKAFYLSGATSVLNQNILVKNCTLTSSIPVSVDYGGTLTLDSCTMNANGAYAVIIGADGSGDQSLHTSHAIVKNCTLNKNPATIGHTLLFGNGASGVIDNVTIPQAYDYGIVIKENTGVEIKNSNIVGGTSSALLFKGAISPNAHNNTLTGTGNVGAFQLRNGDSGHKCQNWQLQNNIVNVTGSSKALNIGNNTHDNGGGVCDYNTYQNNSGLGIVRNDTNVVNLTELYAAWADYDVTTNDSHSTVV